MSQPADRSGLYAGLGCYTLWGLLPLLFLAAERAGAGPFEIVAWRTLCAVPAAGALVAATRGGPALSGIAGKRRTLLALLLSSVLIATNWSVYVWAVNSGQVLAGSLGYYLNPLLNMAAGALFFRERLDRSGLLAIALAAVGVGLQGLALGVFPWVSIVLAVSFCGYGLVRKQVDADAQTGLLVECLILSLPAAGYVLWLVQSGAGRFGHDGAATAWLILTGPATVGPLFLFAYAARRLPLTTVGFLQFIAPTLQFVIGVANGEQLNALRLLSFAFIWSGVALFAGGAWHRSRATRSAGVPIEA